MSSGDHFVSSNAQDKNANHVRRPSNLSTIDNRNEKILNDGKINLKMDEK